MRGIRWWPIVAVAVLLTVASTAQTGANTVGTTKAEDDARSITPDDLRPTQCSGISVTAKRSGSGTITGSSSAELITGGTGVDSISGANGNDCILGGDGADTLNGGSGTDVCIGGAGTDTFSGCETQIQ